MIKRYLAAGGAVALVAIWPLAVGHIGQSVFEDSVKVNDTYAELFDVMVFPRTNRHRNVPR
ncbi:hypothetical protein [Thaumasiovibrio subtropicus]|uniref:hypothetical protein n=1 Tax=Thaumasiovibrio subtropicus TaxID=1891207 RepID=UPI001C860377|nr:hypothetical protein [Thaumasiovibrio subtropicus]